MLLHVGIADPNHRPPFVLGDFLILNLVSREQFWMKRVTIANQVRTKAGDQNAVGLNRLFMFEVMIRWMVAGKDGIEIQYEDRLGFEDRTEILGKILDINFSPVQRHL